MTTLTAAEQDAYLVHSWTHAPRLIRLIELEAPHDIISNEIASLRYKLDKIEERWGMCKEEKILRAIYGTDIE